jgi:hypothetical protein
LFPPTQDRRLWTWRPSRLRRRRTQPRAVTPLRLVGRLLFVFCLGLGLGFGEAAAMLTGYVMWTERLTAEERPLVGRWYALRGNDGAELKIFEYGPDRVFRMQTLRRGEVRAPAEQSIPLRWAARDGQLLLTAPLQGSHDRLARAFGEGANRVLADVVFRIRDADTLETKRDGPWTALRRVPADLASDADLFGKRPEGP